LAVLSTASSFSLASSVWQATQLSALGRGVGVGVFVGGTGVAVGGTGVAVDVGGTGVSVGGTGVAVDVGGTGVAVGGGCGVLVA
jgi:hypothetical protein